MKICPRCGSKNVDWIIPQNWSVWECKDCGYTGPIIDGDEKNS
ncbi:transposase [Methanobrevibacter arboriphilus]|nr:transposase [Methanobrevibacter arboriphilus]